MAEQTWGIVATVDEPAQLLVAFAAYHLAIGAAQLHIYFDNPNPEAEAALASLPRLSLTLCDEAHWARSNNGKRPVLRTGRQAANLRDAYAKTGVDWLMHIDADEFVRDPKIITDAIANAPDDVIFYQLGMLERVRRLGAPVELIFGGIFRAYDPTAQDWAQDLYGRFAKFMPDGFAGHGIGKAMMRTGNGTLDHDVHFPREQMTNRVPNFERLPRALYHFDGLTPLHTVLKLHGRYDWQGFSETRKPDTVGRGAQLRYVRNNRMKQAQLERLIEGIQFLTPAQEAALDVKGLLETAPFDPTPQLAQMGVSADLSAAGFDAALRLRMAERIADTAFANVGFGETPERDR